MLGPGLHGKFLKVKVDLDVYDDTAEVPRASPRWVAGVHPGNTDDTYYVGYVVGTGPGQHYATEREALVALELLLFAVMRGMNPFVKKAKRAR